MKYGRLLLEKWKMARGKYLSLEEARKSGKLNQFAKEHPGEGDAALWKRLFLSMAGVKTPPEADPASSRDESDD